jgi:hypothetical protein
LPAAHGGLMMRVSGSPDRRRISKAYILTNQNETDLTAVAEIQETSGTVMKFTNVLVMIISLMLLIMMSMKRIHSNMACMISHSLNNLRNI